MKFVPELDPGFQPAALKVEEFLQKVARSGKKARLWLGLERNGGYTYVYKTAVFSEDAGRDEENFAYVERLVKSMLWVVGGYKIFVLGPKSVYEFLKKAYTREGLRAFDVDFMETVYESPFEVIYCEKKSDFPREKELSMSVGGHLDGCRIGFDAGGSDRKVSAVVDGKAVYSEEVVWHPKVNADPQYHYDGILDSMKRAAEKMPRVDAIGVSSAGVYVDNKIMVASLFLKVPKEEFAARVKNMYLDVAKEFGDVPLEVANDGDVTALAGAMDLDDNRVLGIAMGTSEAVGYIDRKGNLKGWLNELAFVPVDFNREAMVDEWSGDYGCGVKYFSQDSVIKLAPRAGIELDEKLTPAEKLKAVQELMAKNDPRARSIYETIGIYLGYSVAYYSLFYDIRHLLLLGRVTSGEGGSVILENAKKVLEGEFKKLSKIHLLMPDESAKRVGQSIAAASLPKLKK